MPLFGRLLNAKFHCCTLQLNSSLYAAVRFSFVKQIAFMSLE